MPPTRIFPNEDSIVRLVGTVLLEQNDEWQLQHRYMQIKGFTELAQTMIEEENQLSCQSSMSLTHRTLVKPVRRLSISKA